MSNMSRGRKPLSQQNLRNPKNRTKKKVGKAKSISRLRRSTRDYSKGKEPSGDTGTIPMPPPGGESGLFIDTDNKSYRYTDKPKSAGLKKKLKAKKK